MEHAACEQVHGGGEERRKFCLPLAYVVTTYQDIGPIDSNTDVERIRKHPYTLPDAFEWIDIDVDNDDDMSQVCGPLQ